MEPPKVSPPKARGWEAGAPALRLTGGSSPAEPPAPPPEPAGR